MSWIRKKELIMENKGSALKIAFTYIAIFLLVILIIIPPVFRIVFKEDKNNSNDVVVPKTVLHCTKEEVIGEVTYNVQTFSTYSDKILEKVIIRYTKTGTLDDTNQDNQYEQEIANLSSNSNINISNSNNGYKFEILKDTLATKATDPVVGLYSKNLETEQSFLTSNNYVCQVSKN